MEEEVSGDSRLRDPSIFWGCTHGPITAHTARAALTTAPGFVFRQDLLNDEADAAANAGQPAGAAAPRPAEKVRAAARKAATPLILAHLLTCVLILSIAGGAGKGGGGGGARQSHCRYGHHGVWGGRRGRKSEDARGCCGRRGGHGWRIHARPSSCSIGAAFTHPSRPLPLYP